MIPTLGTEERNWRRRTQRAPSTAGASVFVRGKGRRSNSVPANEKWREKECKERKGSRLHFAQFS